MSEDKISELEAKLSVLGRVVKLGYVLIGGAFAIGVWVTTLELRVRDVPEIKTNLSSLLTWQATSQESKYTISDHSKYSALVQEILNNQDKRLQRLEDSTAAITKSLERIENKLGSKP